MLPGSHGRLKDSCLSAVSRIGSDGSTAVPLTSHAVKSIHEALLGNQLQKSAIINVQGGTWTLKRCEISIDHRQLGVCVQKKGVLSLVKCRICPGPAAGSNVGGLAEAGGTLMLRDTHVLGVSYAFIYKRGTTAEAKGCIFENVEVAIAFEEESIHLQVCIFVFFLKSICA
jgi:hypothetical protein